MKKEIGCFVLLHSFASLRDAGGATLGRNLCVLLITAPTAHYEKKHIMQQS